MKNIFLKKAKGIFFRRGLTRNCHLISGLSSGDQGLVLGQKLGEESFLLEGPGGFGEDFPCGMCAEQVGAPGEIVGVVGAEVQTRFSGEGKGSEAVEQRGLDEPVLVVAGFWPGVGEEEKDFAEPVVVGNGGEQLVGLGFDEVEVGEALPVAFAVAALNALGEEVNADAEFFRLGGGVGGEKMSVPAADFQGEVWLAGEQGREVVAQGGDARGALGFDGGSHFFGHGAGANGGEIFWKGKMCRRGNRRGALVGQKKRRSGDSAAGQRKFFSRFLAAGLARGDGGEFRREGVGGVGGETHCEEGNEGHGKLGCTVGAVHQGDGGDGVSFAVLHDVECLLDAPAACDHILDHQHALAGGDFKISPQHQPVVFLFDKDETFAELAGDFLPDHQTAHRRGQHHVAGRAGEFWEEEFDQSRDLVEVLADLGTLEKVAAVQPATEYEVAVEQRAGFAENGEDFFLNGIHRRKFSWRGKGRSMRRCVRVVKVAGGGKMMTRRARRQAGGRGNGGGICRRGVRGFFREKCRKRAALAWHPWRPR